MVQKKKNCLFHPTIFGGEGAHRHSENIFFSDENWYLYEKEQKQIPDRRFLS